MVDIRELDRRARMMREARKPVHVLNCMGYSTWCGRDATRTRWIKADDAAEERDRITCRACLSLVTVGWKEPPSA